MEHHLSRRRVGFFGGTFDPIHLGHLNLALNVLEKHKLDQILFCPANFSPEKEGNLPTATKEQRKEMVEIAIKAIPDFSLLENELRREGPSYTIDTIKQLIAENPDTDFFLILGDDIISGLPKWRGIHELLKLAPPIVGTRLRDEISHLPTGIRKVIEGGVSTIPLMEISSSDVRERLIQKKVCQHLVHAKVLDYIKEKKLY